MTAADHVIVVGRGHGGTRIPAQILYDAGYYMGVVNTSYDHIPGEAMYEAVRYVGALVKRVDQYDWDFTNVLDALPSLRFVSKVQEYLASLLGHKPIAWKLPESVLGLPWLVQLFPFAYYIHWVRDGRDSILGEHGTDDLKGFCNVPAHQTADRLHNAAVSWKYHLDLVAATPLPHHWLELRFEDYVNNPPGVVGQIEQFLGASLPIVPANRESVGRWTNHIDMIRQVIPILEPRLCAYGYKDDSWT